MYVSGTFAELLVQRLRSQAELLKSLTKHPTLVGSGREGAFRDLVREMIPRRFEVLEGTVAGPISNTGKPSRSSRQVDCMLVDTFTYPTLLRSGNLAVVLHQAVRAIVELKGLVFEIKGTQADAFRRMLVQVGSLKDELALDDTVLTALLVFDDNVTLPDLRNWLEAAITYRNGLLASNTANEDRDALSTGMLPQYIITSSGLLVEKQVHAAYLFYELDPHSAIVFLLASLLRVASLTREDAEHFGVLTAIGGNPGNTRDVRLATAYTEFTTHFGSPPLPKPSGAELDLADPRPPSQGP